MSDLSSLIFLIVIGTSVWVWIDARSKAKNTAEGRISGRKPFEWFLWSLLFWIIGFPLYLVRRGQTRVELQNTSQDSQPKPQLSVLERERLISQREAEQRECLERIQSLEERYKQTKDETLVPRIQALREAAKGAETIPETYSRGTPTPNSTEQDQARKGLQAKWESRTPDDLLEEARVLTEEYKRSHDETLIARIQALRRTADERRRSKSEPKAIQPPQPHATKDLSKLAAYTLMAIGGLIVVSWLFTKACINTSRVETATKSAKEMGAEEAPPHESLATSEGRTKIARKLEETLLQTGMDASVTAVESAEHNTLNISALAVDRPFAHQFVSDAAMISTLKEAGFTDILFVQCCGLEDEYFGTFDLATGQFK